MIAASILEYMFITVACCKQTAKKLFQHRIEMCRRAYFGVASASLLSKFRAFPRPGNFTNTVPELSRTFQDARDP